LAILDRAPGLDAKVSRAKGQPGAPESVGGIPLPDAADGVASERAKHIATGIRSLTVQNLVNSVLGFVFLTMLLRLLPPAEYGLYSAALLVTTIASSIAVFGLQFAATRFVAFMAHDEGESRVVSRSIVVLSLVFTSVATVVYVLLSPAISLYFTKSTSSGWIFAASGGWLFSLTMSGIFQGLVQGMRKYQTLARILVGANLATVGLTVLGLLEFHSVIVPIVGWVVYGIVIIVWSLAITRRPLLVAASARTGGRTAKQVLRYSLPLGVAGIVTVATGAADPIVVGGFLSQTQLGAYYAAIAISGGLGVLLFTPLNTAFFPETSSNANDPSTLSTGLRLAFRYTSLALIPVSFALVGLSKQMIRLFSGGIPTYLLANPSLQMMSAFFLFVAMQGILTSLLLSTGKTTQVMLIGMVTVALDLALSVMLVPSFGLLGAATSRTLVDVAGFLMALYLTRSYLKGVTDFWFQVKLIASSLVMLGVLFGMSKFISNRALTLVPYSLVGVAILLLCARSLRLLTEEDKRYLEHFVPRKVGKVMRQLL
jgi:O-antigen/teichoic acid export membrane protein